MKARLLLGDCRESMRAMPAESIDAVVCDPPYELGFMGKSWDASGIAFDPATWREALRVLKPGGYLLAFGGTRTYHRIAVAIEDAGFEIRDSLIWQYGTGFPKSLNVSIAIDKQAGAMGHRGKAITVAGDIPGRDLEIGESAPAHEPITDAAKRWQGWATALKPAFEPVVVARKPLTKGLTVAANVLAHGTGAINVDACRVGHREERPLMRAAGMGYHGSEAQGMVTDGGMGRWPANVLFTHAPGCVRVGSQKAKATSGIRPDDVGTDYGKQHKSGSMAGAKGVKLGATYADADRTETIAAYECAPGCPVAALDAQSGVLTSGTISPHHARNVPRLGKGGVYGADEGTQAPREWAGDTGGASRFFTTTEYDEDDLPGAKPGDPPFFYNSKASRSEREAGCADLPARSGAEAVDRDEGSAGTQSPRAGAVRTLNNVHNHHPTVKPVAVMRWLIKLVTPLGGVVLDPFMGSGTTGVAAVREGVWFIGCEREAEYLAIAEARIRHAEGEVEPLLRVRS